MDGHARGVGDGKRERGFMERTRVCGNVHDEAEACQDLRESRAPLANANGVAARLLYDDMRDEGGAGECRDHYKNEACGTRQT